jgi:exo-beta-1,3-glucanase (GH17 family)
MPINTNTSLLVGIAADSDTQYQTKKDVLLATLHKYEQHGFDWLLGVSVGSEAARLNVANMSRLISQIYDVKGMIGLVPAARAVQVGHIDTLSGWTISPDMAKVINASNFLGLDVDPYSQGVDVGAANTTLWNEVNTMWDIRQNKTVWVTQSAWSVTGKPIMNASASPGTAMRYYPETLCQASTELPIFMKVVWGP